MRVGAVAGEVAWASSRRGQLQQECGFTAV
jgi:hypothetical protein